MPLVRHSEATSTLKVLLPVEFANCMLVMKLNRSDPSQKPGIVWITSEELIERRTKDSRWIEICPPDRDRSISDSFLDLRGALKNAPH